MAKIVDPDGQWAAAIGKAFIAFGSIEHTVVVCLKEIPRDSAPRFFRPIPLGKKIEFLLEVLMQRQGPECSVLVGNLLRAKDLAESRNLVAHNPLVLSIYENDKGELAFEESISHVYKEGKEMSLSDLQNFADESERLASELIHSSIAAFKALRPSRR